MKKAAQEYRAVVDFKLLFGNENPVHLEVGCGNGGFVCEMARRYPDINFIAVELCSNVVVTAMERVLREEIPNIRFLNVPAEILECYLPLGEIERIYLNFSTPLPQKSREKQRLTAPAFLEIYKKLLKRGGDVVQKTDSEPFFDYSLESFSSSGFRVLETTRDLHKSEWTKENVVTEYEAGFASKGLPIYRARYLFEGGE